MLPQPSRLLVDDHQALDKVLKQLKSALDHGDIEISYVKLDLFWARLAVHIRAEHLHLFPAVLNRLTDTMDQHAFAPRLVDAQTVIDSLRADHDYFMHQLAAAIETMRTLRNVPHKGGNAESITDVRDTIHQIEQRLVGHNESEEKQIYRWAATVLGPQEQEALARAINTQLANRPPRFPENVWSND